MGRLDQRRRGPRRRTTEQLDVMQASSIYGEYLRAARAAADPLVVAACEALGIDAARATRQRAEYDARRARRESR
jgi:hypothetical protein